LIIDATFLELLGKGEGAAVRFSGDECGVYLIDRPEILPKSRGEEYLSSREAAVRRRDRPYEKETKKLPDWTPDNTRIFLAILFQTVRDHCQKRKARDFQVACRTIAGNGRGKDTKLAFICSGCSTTRYRGVLLAFADYSTSTPNVGSRKGLACIDERA